MSAHLRNFYNGLHRRNTFLGLTDTIPQRSPRMGNAIAFPDDKADNLDLAIKAKTPFDAAGNTLSATYIEDSVARMAKYRELQEVYDGNHFNSPYVNGIPKKVANFCRVIVDKGAIWHTAQGFSIEPGAYGGNQRVADEVTKVWKANSMHALMLESASMAATMGDAYIYASVRTHVMGIALPKKYWYVYMKAVNPRFVHPVYSGDSENMVACWIQYPAIIENQLRLYSLYITPNEYYVYHDTELKGKYVNYAGVIPVVHIRNFTQNTSVYGRPDLTDDLVNLNMEYNQAYNACSKVVRYCGQPTTVVYGAKIQELERSADGLISNLPPDAKVETLKPVGDLGAMQSHMDTTLSLIGTMSGIPKILLEGNDFRVSNTSGIAMQLLFQPLIEKTKTRRIPAKKAYEDLNKIIIRCEENVIGRRLQPLADDKDHYDETTVRFTSILPKDKQQELDMLLKMLSVNITSHAQAMRQTNEAEDLEKLAIEIGSDRSYELMKRFEESRANQGYLPNPVSCFLSSVSLNGDLSDTIKELGDLAERGAKAIADTSEMPEPAPIN